MRRFAMAALSAAGCAFATDYDRFDRGAGESPPVEMPDGIDAGKKPLDAAIEAAPGSTAPKFVQSGTGHAKATTTIPATLAATTAGNLIVVAIASEEADVASVASIADNAGNTYVSAQQKSTDFPCDDSSEIWFAKDIKAGATTLTVTMTAAVEAEVWVIEASGLSRTNPLDKGAVASSTTKTKAVIAPPVTPSAPNALVVSTACSCEAIGAIQMDNPFVNLPVQIGEGAAWFISDKVGSYGAIWTSDLGTFNASTVAFKP